MPNPIYALILAGGSGERFWPLSRRACPKQLLRLVSDKTLLEETLGRLEGVVPPDHTLILTNTDQESAVRKLLGGFPKENIIAEPAKRDTAARSPLGLAGSWPAIMQAQCSFSQPITSLPTRKLSRKRWLWLPKQLRRQASLSPSGSNQHGPVPATVTLSKANQSCCATTQPIPR